MSSITRLANFISLIVLSGRAVLLALIGGLMVAFAIWLVLSNGSSWLLDVIAAYVGWKGLEVVGLGLEPFARKPNAQPMPGPRGAAHGIYGHSGTRGREQGRLTLHGQRGGRY